jgi:hypothetical protein
LAGEDAASGIGAFPDFGFCCNYDFLFCIGMVPNAFVCFFECEKSGSVAGNCFFGGYNSPLS